MSNRKVPIFKPCCFVFLFVFPILFSCSQSEIEEKYIYNDIEVPFQGDFRTDTVDFARLASKQARKIFRLDEPSSSIVDAKKYTFKINELVQVHVTEHGDSIRITSYSAKDIAQVSLEIYLPNVGLYLPVAYFPVIPGFSQFEFKPDFLGRRVVYQKPDGQLVSFECSYLDLSKYMPRLLSDDSHWKMLQQIDAQWLLYFSNYDWKDANSAGNWREMSPIYAREWVVLMTNYAYMLTTPEYHHVMNRFSEVFGGDLCHNDKQSFSENDYQEFQTKVKLPRSFQLGRTHDGVGGLGGGTTLGIASYNFYGHYASYSGWEAVGHEMMHCMGYSHNSNMTYAVNGVGWTEFIWQLHAWLSREKKLPYLDRHLLDFTNPAYKDYHGIGIREEFLDDAKLEKKIESFYNRSKLVKYFHNNPLNPTK